MDIPRLNASTQKLFAELLEQAIDDAAATPPSGALPGTFVSKTVKGRRYFYVQVVAGDRKEQRYLGPDSKALRTAMELHRTGRTDSRLKRQERSRLCAMLAAGGAATESAPITRALRVLEDAGLFRLGGVLVGTLAFRCYANVLGRRFDSMSRRTRDLDIADSLKVVVALTADVPAVEVSTVLTEEPERFLAVPGLDPRTPSTSFRIRGQQVRVEFLTPRPGRTSKAPVFLAPFGLAAQPIPGLGYLLDGTERTVVVGGEDVLVNVPAPARFALHKLVLSRSRKASLQVRSQRDLFQAEQLLAILLEDRPSDLEEAWRALSRSRKAARLALEAMASLPMELSRKVSERLAL